VLRDHTN